MRYTKERSLLEHLRKDGLPSDSIRVMEQLLSVSNNGKIENLPEKLTEIKKEVFAGQPHELLNTCKNLTEWGLLTTHGTWSNIPGWNNPLHRYVMQFKYSTIIKEEKGTNVIFDSKVKGIIIPRNLAGLFTRKVYASESKHWDENRLIEENETRKLDKEEIRFLCGILAQCDTHGQIEDYNPMFSFLKMQELFEDKSFAVSTGYRVLKQLQEKSILFIHKSRKTGRGTLLIYGYEEGFGPGKNYVVIPFAVFQAIFKRLELAAINLFFEWVFQLNNGDDGKGRITAEKKIHHKVLAAPMDSGADRNRLTGLRTWLRKRNDYEVQALLKGLLPFFCIEHTVKGIIAISINKVYFIAKSAFRRASSSSRDALLKYKRKAELIRLILGKYENAYRTKDLEDLTRLFAYIPTRITRRIMEVLSSDMKDRREQEHPAIRSIVAYGCSLYKQYQLGISTKLAKSMAFMESLNEEATAFGLDTLLEDMI